MTSTNFSKGLFAGFVVIMVILSTGCKKKNLHSRVVSVTDFGAKPNDKKDDTRSIQKALNHLGKSGGGILTIPKGIFMVSRRGPQYPGGIYIPSNVHVKGVGEGKSILKLQARQENYTRLIYVQEVRNVTISNLTIDGNRYQQINPEAPNEHLHGILIHSAMGVTIKKCAFQNTAGDGILFNGPKVQSKNITIRNCSFKDNRRNGITLGSGFNGVVIDSCYFDATNIFASSIDSEPEEGICENVKITNNTVINNKPAATLVTFGGHVPVSGYLVRNNKFENTQLLFCNTIDCEVYDNEITTQDPKEASIKVIYGNKDVVVRNNKINSHSKTYEAISTRDGIAGGVDLINNTIITTGKVGGYPIKLQGTQHLTIRDNFFKSTNHLNKSAIYMRTTGPMKHVNIVDNTFEGYQGYMDLQGYQKNTFNQGRINNVLKDVKDVEIKYIGSKEQLKAQYRLNKDLYKKSKN